MKIAQVIPQLRTTDLDVSIRFYTDRLGFTLDFGYSDFYAGIRAGGHVVEHFHLYLETTTPRPPRSSCRLAAYDS